MFRHPRDDRNPQFQNDIPITRLINSIDSLLQVLKEKPKGITLVSHLYNQKRDIIDPDFISIIDRHGSVIIDNTTGNSAFMIACSKGHLERAKYMSRSAELRGRTIRVDHQNHQGRTALMACSTFELCQFLVEECGAMVDIKDKFGRTALDYTRDESIRNYLMNCKSGIPKSLIL